MKNLTNQQLLEVYESNFEFSYITLDNKIVHTDNEEDIPTDRINYCIFHSDFETMFEIKDELVRRDLLTNQ